MAVEPLRRLLWPGGFGVLLATLTLLLPVALWRGAVSSTRLGGADDLAVRIEVFLVGGDLVEVEIGGHLGADLAGPRRLGQQCSIDWLSALR
jgi:hypothetical protein